MTSLVTRSAIIRSRSVSSSVASSLAASPIDSSQISAMLRSLIVTASVSGLSRAPPHTVHGTSRMYPSYCSRDQSLSAPSWRRLIQGRTPSYVVVYWRCLP